jgi:hypothetical protein
MDEDEEIESLVQEINMLLDKIQKNLEDLTTE